MKTVKKTKCGLHDYEKGRVSHEAVDIWAVPWGGTRLRYQGRYEKFIDKKKKNLRELAGGSWLFWRQKTGRMMAVYLAWQLHAFSSSTLRENTCKPMAIHNSYFSRLLYLSSLETAPTAPLSLEIEDASKAKHGRHRM